MDQIPPEFVTFGPDANCTLAICPVEWSIYGFRPSLAANIFFPAAFGVVAAVHAYLGWRWRSWGFMAGMLFGCLAEIIGYVGRIMLYNDPFSFIGFMIQIICITLAPVFFTASIYVTLSKAIVYFAPELSRFKPQLFYWIFIPFDVVCLVLQAAGGAMSTESGSANNPGVDISMAGLALQVIVLTAFIACFADYMIRYLRSSRAAAFDWRLKTFFTGLSVSIVIILARCAYRVAELKDGYDGELIREEGPFIALEGAAILIAAAALCFGHPGLVFDKRSGEKGGALEMKNVSDGGESGDATPRR